MSAILKHGRVSARSTPVCVRSRFDVYEGQIAIQVVVFFVDQDLCLIFLTVRMHLCLCLKGSLCVHVFAYLFVDVFVGVCV